jgi:hypothetical protein
MYVLVLIGYVVAGGGPSVPSQLIVGSYSSEKMCHDALREFDKTRSFREISDNMRDYKWGFICAPSGVGAKV